MPNPERTARVAELVEMAKAATPGPWKPTCTGADAWVDCPDGRRFCAGDMLYHEGNDANAALIAAAPEMASLLQEYEEENAAAREAFQARTWEERNQEARVQLARAVELLRWQATCPECWPCHAHSEASLAFLAEYDKETP